MSPFQDHIQPPLRFIHRTPLGVALAGLLAGCAGTSAEMEAQAAHDLNCDSAVSFESVDREHQVAEGCGRSQPYERRCEQVGSYRKSWECSDWTTTAP